MDDLKLRQKIEEIKGRISAEKDKLEFQKSALNAKCLELDRKKIENLLPKKKVEAGKSEAPKLDDVYVFQIKGGRVFAAKSKHFDRLKTGFLNGENLKKLSAGGLIVVPEEVCEKSFEIILEHIRTKKLKNIGIPREMKGRVSLLNSVLALGGLEALLKRIQILCFVESLDLDDSEDKSLKLENELIFLETQLEALQGETEKNSESIKEFDKRIDQEGASGETVPSEPPSERVPINVGGTIFNIPYDSTFNERFAGTFLHEIVDSVRKSGNPCFVDKSSSIFQLIFDYLFNPGDFVALRDIPLDVKEQFVEEADEFLKKKDILEFPEHRLGIDDLQLKIEEDRLRELFVSNPTHPLIKDSPFVLLQDVFKTNFGKVLVDKKLPLLYDFENQKSTFLSRYQSTRLPSIITGGIDEFRRNFTHFTAGVLEGLDFSNVFIAGGSIVANLLNYHELAVPEGEEQLMKRSLGNKGAGTTGGVASGADSLERFKENENLKDFSHENLDMFQNEKYEKLLTLPISPLLLKRLIAIEVSVKSVTQFTLKTDQKYGGKDVPPHLQFFSQLIFQRNLFTYNKQKFRFTCGSQIPQNLFPEVPADAYPLCLSEDNKVLIYASLTDTKQTKDFNVYSLPGNDAFPLPVSKFVGKMRVYDDSEFVSVPEKKVFTREYVRAKNTFFGKSDIDMFVYGLTEDQARAKIKEVYEVVHGNIQKSLRQGSKDVLVIRTPYAITMQFHKRRPIQIILRLYKSPSEILTGFDLDSCCVGYDGKTVWALPRFQRAMRKRFNVVNVERQSTTYELRLWKYAKRGFRVCIPGFNREFIAREGLKTWDPTVQAKSAKNIYANPSYLNTSGLARLLVLEHKLKKQNVMLKIVDRSDYDGDFLTLPGKLRRSNPVFVERLVREKVVGMQRKWEHLQKYAGIESSEWKCPMVFLLNNIDLVLNYTKGDSTLDPLVKFVIENPGGQRRVTSSFCPVVFNFFEGAYLPFKKLVEKRWQQGMGYYSWWYSHDSKSFRPFFSHTSKLIEKAHVAGEKTLDLKNVKVDFGSMSCRQMGGQYSLLRVKDFKLK